ncbi:ABC transporter permease [Pseudarthrobacter sulfonivorans]|uniref:ABC transporter permease n=1 Tax=Pseudarthrobacter sulfonivorans TaxID=121292 RepID=UPI00168A7609|nr:ABC transporter permease [Pseudarthrobacter sulfonivorans]
MTLRFLSQRVISLIPLLFLLILIVFVMVQLAPGDPAAIAAGPDASPEAVEQVRRSLGLDGSFLDRLVSYISGAVRGDLGTSYVSKESVTDIISRRLPRTLSLVVLAMIVSVVASIPLGIIAALNKGSWLDRGITGLAVFLLAVPPFVFAAILVGWFALGGLRIFPPTGYMPMSEGFGEWFKYAALPALAIATISLAELTRMMRGSLVDTLEEDYIRTANAKGLNRLRIVGKHAMKNAAIPFITILGLQVGRIIGAAVIVEAIFNIRGFGQLGVEAVLQRDMPILQGVVLVSGLIVIITNLAVDISYGFLNPRTRTQ